MIKTLFETDLTDLAETDVEGVGILRYEDNGNVYRWVKNRNATAFTAKMGICYDVGNVGSKALFQSVNAPVTADLMVQAGIAVTAIAASGGDCFGWILTQGYFQDARVLAVSGTAVAVGDELVTANGTTTLTRATVVGAAPKRRFTFQALEVLAGTTGATLARDVYVACL